jgi:aldose 1-epimerase
MIELGDGDLTALVDLRFGNNLFSLKLRDREFLWTPPDFRSKPALGGIPLLAPWANRIDGDSYFANGKRFLLNPDLGNLRRDGNGLAIHGLLAFTDCWRIWKQTASWVTCRLQFWLEPPYMAQFPFAHTLEITYALRDGALEVQTEIRNLSTGPLPLCIGFHPYFQLPDSPRDEWTLRIPARRAVTLSDKLTPTGETTPFDPAATHPLKNNSFDSVFCDLTGEEFSAQSKSARLAVRFGPKYTVAIVYAPPDKQCFCFEPMTALTNAFNLDHAGKNAYLKAIAPGDTWRESFWIRPEA